MCRVSPSTFVFQYNQGATIATCVLHAKRMMSKRKSFDVSFKLKAIECRQVKKWHPGRWAWTLSRFGNGAQCCLPRQNQACATLTGGHAAPTMTTDFILKTMHGIRQK